MSSEGRLWRLPDLAGFSLLSTCMETWEQRVNVCFFFLNNIYSPRVDTRHCHHDGHQKVCDYTPCIYSFLQAGRYKDYENRFQYLRCLAVYSPSRVRARGGAGSARVRITCTSSDSCLPRYEYDPKGSQCACRWRHALVVRPAGSSRHAHQPNF